MDRLLQADKEAYVRVMRAEVERTLGQVMEAVNHAPDGNVINGSEMEVRDLMSHLRQRVFEQALQMRLDSTESSFSPPAAAAGGNKQNKGRESRSGLSVNGRVDLHRRRWYAPGEGSEHPLDRLLDAAEATVSVGVRKLCCELGIDARSFARSVQRLKSTAQLTMGEEQFRQIVEQEGKAAVALSAKEELEVGWSASQCKTTTPSGEEVSRLYGSADGVMVPTITQAEKDKRRARILERRKRMPRAKRRRLSRLAAVKKGTDQRYKQVYVTSFYDQLQEHRLVGVTAKGAAGLSRLLRRDAARVLLRGAQERRGMVDGAVCLRSNLEVLPLDEVMLDFYHFSEHVGEAGKATLGEEEAKGWIQTVLHLARNVGYEPMFEQLLDWRGKLRGGKRGVADGLINYAAQRQEMMGYERCDERGWDVGSGPMESMCGVTTDRIKGRGRRWNLENAEAVMELEALQQSDLWQRYWGKAFAGCN